MRSIWKFPLGVALDDAAAEVTMPAGAAIVHFALQGGEPTVWAQVDSDEATEVRRFRIFGTRHPLPRGVRHVGTYGDGPFVRHVFEMIGEPLPDGLDLPADAEAAYRTLAGAGFTLREVRDCERPSDPPQKAWVAPDDEPLTTEQMMAVATLHEYGFGSVISA